MLYFKEPLIKQFAEVENPQKGAERLALKYLNLCKQTRNLVTENEKGDDYPQPLFLASQDVYHDLGGEDD